jgi:acetylornithine deacetylase/succinyl-diaminopimelate desuccinylase-like protein
MSAMQKMPGGVVELAQELVRIPSVNPDGDPGIDQTGEENCARWVGEFLRAAGAEVFLDEVAPGRPNVIGRFPTLPAADGKPKPRLLFGPHTDTVSVAGMTIAPFDGAIRDGRLWGRGASDTKGPMAAMLWALWEMRAEIPSLPVEVHFAGFMSEESSQLGSRHFAANHPPYDLALVAEPTGLETVHTHKGCLWIDVITRGRAAHGARPELGDNAIVKMARLIDALDSGFRDELARLGPGNEFLSPSTVNIGMIRGGSRSNIVADHCSLRLDIRATPALARQGGARQVLADFVHSIDPAAEVPQAPDVLALDTNPEHPLIQALLRCGSRLAGAPWFCDAVFLAAAGTPAVAIGPGSIEQAHTPDEFILLSDLEAGAAFFQKYLRSLSQSEITAR